MKIMKTTMAFVLRALLCALPRPPALRRPLLCVAAAATLAGCALPVTHPGTSFQAPADWREAAERTPADLALEADWWRRFDSTELEALVADALAGSPDLAEATERVVQAEIAARSAGAALFPTVNLDAATTLGRVRGNASGAANADKSAVGLGISYEIDVWGSNIANWKAARIRYDATRYDYEATRLSLVAGVANAYVQVLTTRARLAIARDNLAIAERLFTIVEARYRHGAASALDVSRQRAQVLAQRDTIAPMQAQERQSLRALAILAGRLPQGFDVSGRDLDPLAIPTVAAPLPSELLARRPDLAAAEARLAAADADIVIARAALFPLTLSLGASAGVSSGKFGLVGLTDPLRAANLTVSLMQAIFDGGRLRGQVETSESQRRQTLETYRRAALTALKETEDALSDVTLSQTQEVSQLAIRAENERALRLSELRYREGSDTLSTLLDAQRNLFSAQDSLVLQRQARLNAAVGLYKALGGGWLLDPAQAAEPLPAS